MPSRPKLRVEGHDVTTLPASGVGEGDKVKVFLGTEDAFEAVVEAVRIGNPQNGLNSISATVEEVDLEGLPNGRIVELGGGTAIERLRG
ncbi:MAG: hypothetical protein ACD_52C00094G0007 [uncultured bacterium]|nr:MAG: hypothetical protein ACD_52C00094G0007 [uncultured bacterium]